MRGSVFLHTRARPIRHLACTNTSCGGRHPAVRLGDRAAMSTASVLIAADPSTPTTDTPRYTLLLSTDPALIEAAQRLRHDVFTAEPGFALKDDGHSGGLDADRFDEFCDHLLVREDNSGELVGCYRMLPPSGAVARTRLPDPLTMNDVIRPAAS